MTINYNYALSKKLNQLLNEKQLQLTFAESCTAGNLSLNLTDVAGSSAIFERSFICYGNAAKSELLGVSGELLKQFNAVSKQCAIAMAEGALLNSQADIALSATGIAGPGGGSPDKPVGTVWLGLADRLGTRASQLLQLSGGRENVRRKTTQSALLWLIEYVKNLKCTPKGRSCQQR